MLTAQDLYSLEQYSAHRPDYKRRAVEHRKRRQIRLGMNMTLHFEDRVTVQYQIQEMLLIVRMLSLKLNGVIKLHVLMFQSMWMKSEKL